MQATRQKQGPPKPKAVPLEPTFLVCRAAFIARIKKEHREILEKPRLSFKRHPKGIMDGFYSRQLQRRWLDFRAGWLANSTTKSLNLCTDKPGRF